MTKLYGDKFTLQDFASAAGAPDNATVILDYSAPFHNIPAKFAVYIKAPELGEMTRTFTVDKRGRPIIKNDIFETVQTGTGLGLKLFSRQVNNATALGFKAIKTNAAREDGVFNGYSTWVKFGYNNKLDPGTRSILPPELKGARSMHELRQTQAGRDWWEANGTSTDMRFNLNPGSRSHRILKDYSAKKASQPPRPAPKPWSPPESQMFTL